MTTDHYRIAIAKADSDSEIYDAIMAEGKRVMMRHRDVGDPYEMHKAFEWMCKECAYWGVAPQPEAK